MPAPGKLQAKTALPHPPRTSQKVPMNSAKVGFICFCFSVWLVDMALPGQCRWLYYSFRREWQRQQIIAQGAP